MRGILFRGKTYDGKWEYGDLRHGGYVHDCLLKCTEPYHEFDGVIGYRDGSFVVVGEVFTHYRWLDYDVIVSGNVHDTPELLEGE